MKRGEENQPLLMVLEDGNLIIIKKKRVMLCSVTSKVVDGTNESDTVTRITHEGLQLLQFS